MRKLSPLKAKWLGLSVGVVLSSIAAAKLIPVWADDPAPQPAPFDLVFAATRPTDSNGFMRNPKWGWQKTHRDGSFPDPNDLTICPRSDFRGTTCSTQATGEDTPDIFNLIGCVWVGRPQRVHGHVNWTVATYSGLIRWEDWSADGDYCFGLKPEDNSGLTTNSGGFLHCEFDSLETIDGFQTPTWTMLRNNIECPDEEEPCDEKKVRATIDGDRAVVVGLVGLDSEHGGYTELHPVYALAIEVNPNPENNTWLIFMRNWGDEGFCSRHDHPLPKNLASLHLDLPAPPNSQPSGVEILSQSQFATLIPNDCASVNFVPDQGIVVSLALPAKPVPAMPYGGPITEGELHLKWVSPVPLNPFKVRPLPGANPGQMTEEYESLTPPQKKKFLELRRQQMEEMLPTAFSACPSLAGVVKEVPAAVNRKQNHLLDFVPDRGGPFALSSNEKAAAARVRLSVSRGTFNRRTEAMHRLLMDAFAKARK